MSNTQMEGKPQAGGPGIINAPPRTAAGYYADNLIDEITEHAEHLTWRVNSLTRQVRALEYVRDRVEAIALTRPAPAVYAVAVIDCEHVCQEAEELIFDTEPAECRGPCMDADSQPATSTIGLVAARERAGVTLDHILADAALEPGDAAAGIRRVAAVLAKAMQGTDPAAIMESRGRAYDATRYLLGLGPMGEI